MQGTLLSALRPYQQIFALFALDPPPSCYANAERSRYRLPLLLLFGLYALFVIVFSCYETHITTAALMEEIEYYQLNDFTSVLGRAQKVLLAICVAVIQLNVLLNFRRLVAIHVDITQLERDIELAALRFGGLQRQRSFRWRLATRCAPWLLLLCIALPRVTVPALGDFMSLPSKFVIDTLMLMVQLKFIEFGMFVQLVLELLLRLRQSLCQLRRELATCEQLNMLQALCLALRCNQLLMARIWRLVGKLEAYFMLPMLLLFLYEGLTILHIVNWAYIQSLNPNDCCRFWRLGHVTVLLANTLTTCWMSDNCIDTYNSFMDILHSIHCPMVQSQQQLLTMRLREYSLQMQHLKLLFTCGGFFDINLKSFGALVITIFSYAVILIQFKLQGQIETKNQT